MKVKCKCLTCGKEFEAYPSKIKRGGGKYHSRSCWYKSQKLKENGKRTGCTTKGRKSPNYKTGKYIDKI
jgi:hypothetical protein